LILKDIGKLAWVKSTTERVSEVLFFIRGHQRLLAIVRKRTAKDFILPCKTRFATQFLTLQRLSTLQDSLRLVVASVEWESYRSELKDKKMVEKIDFVQCTIQDRLFFSSVNKLVELMKPIVMLLRFVDGANPTTGKIWHKMSALRNDLLNILEEDKEKSSEVCSSKHFLHFLFIYFFYIHLYL
jgi:hypothetical protein